MKADYIRKGGGKKQITSYAITPVMDPLTPHAD